jgi:hypothetical protein
MEVWLFQYYYNGLYRAFCHLIGKTPANVTTLQDIPFLPIQMFRDQEVMTGNYEPQMVFRSSGTTGSIRSQHFIRDPAWYNRISEKCFTEFLGDPGEYEWLGLLPSYLDRPDSSLIEMVRYFISINHPSEGSFYPHIDDSFLKKLENNYNQKRPTILIGVSFALLDLCTKYEIPAWDELIVIETGGMKGRGAELTREELHEQLRSRQPLLQISSEYGMTELLSQAYMRDARFIPPATMKILARDISDPMQLLQPAQRGAISIIDLANLDSCAFIATDDVGIVYENGHFDITGRLDQSDIRGCNLLYN